VRGHLPLEDCCGLGRFHNRIAMAMDELRSSILAAEDVRDTHQQRPTLIGAGAQLDLATP
jgi:hypothetical protein